MLLAAWQNLLVYDIEDLQKLAKTCNFTPNEIRLLSDGQNPNVWEKLKKENKRQFNYQREKFKKLVALNGAKRHQPVNELIQNEWNQLFNNCTNLQGGENDKLYNLTIKIKGKDVQLPNPIKKRVCRSCGKDISSQKGGSKFCSQKNVGEVAAHQCRNNNSNPRNNFRNKFIKLTSRGLLFDIAPYFSNQNGNFSL